MTAPPTLAHDDIVLTEHMLGRAPTDTSSAFT